MQELGAPGAPESSPNTQSNSTTAVNQTAIPGIDEQLAFVAAKLITARVRDMPEGSSVDLVSKGVIDSNFTTYVDESIACSIAFFMVDEAAGAPGEGGDAFKFPRGGGA